MLPIRQGHGLVVIRDTLKIQRNSNAVRCPTAEEAGENQVQVVMFQDLRARSCRHRPNMSCTGRSEALNNTASDDAV